MKQRKGSILKSLFGSSRDDNNNPVEAVPDASPRMAEIKLIQQSGLFDANWYREQYHWIGADTDPIEHYVSSGAAEGYAPHPLFMSWWYAERQPDLLERGLTPLGHFILHGDLRGENPHPLFDTAWYRKQSAELSMMTSGLFRHYLERGWAERHSPPRPSMSLGTIRSVLMWARPT